MQIQRVQSSNPSFGYNPTVNAKLMHKLSATKKNKAYCDYLKNLCVATNQTELKLREAEKKNMPQLQNRLEKLFLPIKVILTDLIDAQFPKLNYKQQEIETYAEEVVARHLEEDHNHWLNGLIEWMSKEEDFGDYPEVVEGVIDGAAEGTEEGIDPGQVFAIITAQVKQRHPDAEVVSSSEMPEIEEKADDAAEELKESIELGKSKCIEYKPYGEALKGFAGLGGMKELKELLNDRIVGALKNPKQAELDFVEYGKKSPRGILFYGPPGCGKTTITEHLATEAGVKLLKVEAGSVGGIYVHETSIYTDAVFNYAESIATKDKPVIVLIDDADAFFTKRNEHSKSWEAEEMATFLNRIQKAGDNNVVVIAATNRYDIMDEAIRSRFEEQIYVGLPDFEARKAIVKMFMSQRTKGKAIAENEDALNTLAQKLDKFPIRAIKMISDKASIAALKDGRRDITVQDFEKIISENKNMQVKEENYKTNVDKKPIGF